jgi:hypothetical protein
MLTPSETSEDFELKEGSAWITVGNISVYIRKSDEGVAVDLFPVGDEMSDSLAGTWLTFAEAEPVEDF